MLQLRFNQNVGAEPCYSNVQILILPKYQDKLAFFPMGNMASKTDSSCCQRSPQISHNLFIPAETYICEHGLWNAKLKGQHSHFAYSNSHSWTFRSQFFLGTSDFKCLSLLQSLSKLFPFKKIGSLGYSCLELTIPIWQMWNEVTGNKSWTQIPHLTLTKYTILLRMESVPLSSICFSLSEQI